MSKRIEGIFRENKAAGRATLVGFASAGCPTPAESLAFMEAMAEGGADILEIGVPFSDPMADGATIQAASQKALAAGTRLADVFALCAELRRRRPDLGIVLFSYYNPIFHAGVGSFARKAAAAGADAVLVVDVPLEERDEVKPALEREGLDLVPLVSPATPPERMKAIATGVSGFVYYIMYCGVTGVRDALPDDLEANVRLLREASGLPIAAGFGVSSPAMAGAVARVADGVVIGSAFVKVQLDETLDATERAGRARDMARAFSERLLRR